MQPQVKLVWDGEQLTLPSEMGEPAPHQFTGSPLDNLVESAGRVCFDAKTEILALHSGWVRFADLPKGEPVATLNQETERIEFQVPTDYISRRYTGSVYENDTATVSIRCTADHELFVTTVANKTWRFVKAEKLLGSLYRVRRAGRYDGSLPLVLPVFLQNVPQAELFWPELLARCLRGGDVGNGKVRFHKCTDKVRVVLERLGLPCYNSLEDGVGSLTVNHAELAEFLAPYSIAFDNRRLPVECFEWPLPARLRMIHGFFVGKKTRLRFRTYSLALANDVQRLVCTSGSYSSLFKRDNYELWISKRNVSAMNSNFQKKLDLIDYAINERVYCVSVPNRVIMIRRKNKPLLVGNCYDSCGSPKSRSSSEYHKHIVEVGHGCYDERTEVLTEDGWKHWRAVTLEDRLATLNSGQIEYQQPIKLFRYHHSGRMYKVEGGINLLVTPDHNLYVRQPDQQGYSLVAASKLDETSAFYSQTGNWTGNKHVNPDVARLLGFMVDRVVCCFAVYRVHHGFVDYYLHFSQSNCFDWTKNIAASLNWSFAKSNQRDEWYVLEIPNQYEPFFSIFNKPCGEFTGTIPLEVIKEWDRPSVEAFLEGLLHSSGGYSDNEIVYRAKWLPLASQIQQLCLHAGRTVIIRESQDSFDVLAVIQPKGGDKQATGKWVKDWSGDVFCAEVPNHILFVRRYGCPVWCGNSVQEHANFTVQTPLIPEATTELALVSSLLNRPGVFATKTGDAYRITANLRSVREWYHFGHNIINWLGDDLQAIAGQLAPLVLFDHVQKMPRHMKLVRPESDDEIWVSLFFHNISRGLSHELVRHRRSTAVSQRSTRFVDEHESPWAWHPLLKEYERSGGDLSAFFEAERLCRETYGAKIAELQQFLSARGSDKLTARKQVRGAVRGVLGNALATELIFSASLAQWKWMILLRAHGAADAEIRVVFNQVYELLRERFPTKFVDFAARPVADGLGYEVFRENGQWQQARAA